MSITLLSLMESFSSIANVSNQMNVFCRVSPSSLAFRLVTIRFSTVAILKMLLQVFLSFKAPF